MGVNVKMKRASALNMAVGILGRQKQNDEKSLIIILFSFIIVALLFVISSQNNANSAGMLHKRPLEIPKLKRAQPLKVKAKKRKKKEKAKKNRRSQKEGCGELQGAGAFASALAQVSRIGKGPQKIEKNIKPT